MCEYTNDRMENTLFEILCLHRLGTLPQPHLGACQLRFYYLRGRNDVYGERTRVAGAGQCISNMLFRHMTPLGRPGKTRLGKPQVRLYREEEFLRGSRFAVGIGVRKQERKITGTLVGKPVNPRYY